MEVLRGRHVEVWGLVESGRWKVVVVVSEDESDEEKVRAYDGRGQVLYRDDHGDS